MTEKRFDFKYEYITLDGGVFATAKNRQDAELISRTLNQLYDESEQLKHRIKKLQNELNNYSEICNELNALVDENEQLKFKLEEVRSDEKQLGISFMEFKMKLIEKLQIHYDYATEQRQKNLDDIFVAKAYDIIRYDIKKLAEEMGVDLE